MRKVEADIKQYIKVIPWGALLLGTGINHFTELFGPSFLTKVLQWLGLKMSTLDSSNFLHKTLVFFIVWGMVIFVAFVMHRFQAIQSEWRDKDRKRQEAVEQSERALKERQATLEQQLSEANKQVAAKSHDADVYRSSYQGFSKFVVALMAQLRLLATSTTDDEMSARFNDLCNAVAYHLNSSIFGDSKDKVTFVFFGGKLIAIAEDPEEIEGLEDHIMDLPVVQGALLHGEAEYLEDVADQPKKVRTQRWQLPKCGAILVIPIKLQGGPSGVFGVYSQDPKFFEKRKDPPTVRFLQAVLEAGARLQSGPSAIVQNPPA